MDNEELDPQAVEEIDRLDEQIDRLAKWFMKNAPEEIKEGGAVDCAIAFMDELRGRVGALDNVCKIQRTDGNWNYAPYMHGMANGLIIALAIMQGVDPQFLDAPTVWLANKKSSGLVEAVDEIVNSEEVDRAIDEVVDEVLK